jgi:hypothetical protein
LIIGSRKGQVLDYCSRATTESASFDSMSRIDIAAIQKLDFVYQNLVAKKHHMVVHYSQF